MNTEPVEYMSAKLYSYILYLYLFGISGWWRQFARLPGDLFGAPVYFTEIVLILGLLVVARVAYGSGDWRQFLFPHQLRKTLLVPLLVILLCLVPLRVIPAYFEFGFQALRDGVMLLYLLFIPLLFWLKTYISIRRALVIIYLGQLMGTLSYYLVEHIAGITTEFLYPFSNEAVAILPVVTVLIFCKRWNMLGAAMLFLAPTMLSQIFWLKRSFLLGSVLVIGALIAYRPETFRNMGKLVIACAVSLVFSIGLLFLPEIAKPVYQDVSVLLGALVDGNSKSKLEPMPDGESIAHEKESRNGEIGELEDTSVNVGALARNGEYRNNPERRVQEEPTVFGTLGKGFEGPRLLHGEDTQGDGLMSWRLHLWKNAWSEAAEKPLWGWGFGPIVVKNLSGGIVLTEETFISGPHNAYITVLFRLGWPLSFIFMVVPLCFLCRAILARHRMEETELVALFVVAYSYFSAFFSLGFESPQNSVLAYVLMGLLVAPLWIRKEALPKNKAEADVAPQIM